MTQSELALAAAHSGRSAGLTGAAVSQFELGDAVPSTDTLAALVAALSIDAEFLSISAVDPEGHLPAFFRSLRATPATDRKRARNLTQLVHRFAAVLDELVGLPERVVPSLPCNPFEDPAVRRRRAEEAASKVRRNWNLPSGPVVDVVATIEAHGIVCTRLQFGEERVDAFSVNFSDHPVVVLANDKKKWDRSRFDAAHELGHLVMHEEAAGLPEAEKQAHEFSAAFLMPADDITSELPDRADWRHLMELKTQWGVSIAALLMRARTLGVMAENTYVSATKVMSSRGWRRHEPIDGQPERPQVLSRALAQAARKGFQPADLRRQAMIPSDIFSELLHSINAS